MKKNSAFKILKPVLLQALSLGLCTMPLSAADSRAGTDGAAFMKIPTGSARAQALGNCGVAMVEGSESMGINPAGIASSQMREFSFSYLSWFAGYSGQHLAYVHPVGQLVLGANAAYYSVDGFDARDQSGIPVYGADIKVRNGYATMTLAKSFFLEKLLLGVSIKGIMEDNYTEKYSNIVFDAGVMFKLGRKLSLGWSGANMAGKAHAVVKAYRLGAAYAFNPFIAATLESKSYSDRKAHLGVGFELTMPEELLQVGKVSLRTGYTATDNLGKNYEDKTLKTLGLHQTTGWAFGMGITTAQAMSYNVTLDYAFVPYGALGKSNQLMLKFQF